MKKITTLLILVILTLVSCNNDDENQNLDGGQCVLNKTNLSLKPGATFTLVAEFIETDETEKPNDTKSAIPRWNSSDKAIATVSPEGLITAISIGKSTITASFGNASATCTVNVLEAPKVNDFYYSDGTWSTVKDASKTCVGLVYCVNFNRATSPTDKTKQDQTNPEYRNLVMGFEEQEDTAWDGYCDRNFPDQTTEITHKSLYNGEYNKQDPAILADITTFSPFSYAANKAKKSGLNWYVPSFYELRKFILVFNGGGIDRILYDDKALQESLLPSRKAYNEKLKEAGGEHAIFKYISAPSDDTFFWQQAMYWTSSVGNALVPEYDNSTALALYMYSTGTDITPFKDNMCNVRPILAFEY